jgi:hypothetical protein
MRRDTLLGTRGRRFESCLPYLDPSRNAGVFLCLEVLVGGVSFFGNVLLVRGALCGCAWFVGSLTPSTLCDGGVGMTLWHAVFWVGHLGSTSTSLCVNARRPGLLLKAPLNFWYVLGGYVCSGMLCGIEA